MVFLTRKFEKYSTLFYAKMREIKLKGAILWSAIRENFRLIRLIVNVI